MTARISAQGFPDMIDLRAVAIFGYGRAVGV